MKKKGKTQKKEVKLLNCSLRFEKRDGRTIVYDGHGRLNEILTEIYNDVAKPSTTANAKIIVHAMHLFLLEAEKRGKGPNADAADVRNIVEDIFSKRYGTSITKTASKFAKVSCGEESNPYTVKTLLSAMRMGFERLIANGWRKGKNPLSAYQPVAKDLSAYREEQMTTASSEFRRTPVCYYRMDVDTMIPVPVTEGSVLPALMKRGGKAAKWGRREHAILGIMVDGGPRVCEAVEVSLYGWMICNFGNQIKLHNKHQGRAPRKFVSLSEDTEKTLNTYFSLERPLQDKRYKHFMEWAQNHKGATYTPKWYAQYMAEFNIDIKSEPLFLNYRGKFYRSETFCRHAWTKARNKMKITPTPHHIRRWYVNKEIRLIYDNFESVREKYSEMKKFIKKMGWQRWKSVRPYDFDGLATDAVELYIANQLDEESSSEHETGAEMMEKLGFSARMKSEK